MSLLSTIKSLFSGVTQKGGAPFPFNQPGLTGVLGGADRMQRPYEQSPWVMRAIKRIASPIAAVSLKFTTEADSDPAADPALAAFWKNPAKGLSYPDFIEATVGWLKLEGEAFWLLDDAWLRPPLAIPSVPKVPFVPTQLLLARPDRMKAILERGTLVGWDFTDRDQLHHSLLPEQVVQPKFWNPYDEYRGLAEYKSARIAADADYLAGKFNLNLMDNNGDQGVYIIAKGGIPTEEQRTQIVMQLREKREQQQRGYFKPVFLSGDISIEDPKVRVPDAAFIASRLENRHEIYIALGVPASMADVVASYSVGSASDRYLLIEETCMPLGVKIAEHISQVTRRMTRNDALCACLNWDEHSVMQQVRRERVESAGKLWGMGMPMEQVSDYLKLDLPEFEGWDIGYLPFNVAPVGESQEPQPDAAIDDAFAEPADDPQQAMVSALKSLQSLPSLEWQRTRDPKEQALWRQHMAGRNPTIKDYTNKFRQVIMRARAQVLAKLARFTSVPGVASVPAQKSSAADFLFNLTSFKHDLIATLRPTALRALDVAGTQLFAEVGRDDPFKYPPKEALEFLHSRENKLSNTSEDIWNGVRNTIDESLKAGDPMLTMAAKIRADFNHIGKIRSKAIAMTETAAAFGQGRAKAMVEAGVQYKKWLTSGNDNVRPAHEEANGQVKEIDEPFDVGEEELMQPGDPAGSPENVINCHCVSIAVKAPEEKSNS